MTTMPDDRKNYDWSDPHHFHSDEEGHHDDHGHHVTSWQFMTLILFALLFFTGLTVWTASAEVWISDNLGIQITQLWNVIIAMSIATVKAMLVCMYFMHLKHDTPLNTYILLFTFVTMSLFMLFPALDLGTRNITRPDVDPYIQMGGGATPGMPVARNEETGKPIREALPYRIAKSRRVEGIIHYAVSPKSPAEGEDKGLGIAIPDDVGANPANALREMETWLRDNGHWDKAEAYYWDKYYVKRSHYDHHIVKHPEDPTDAYERFNASGGGHHGHGDDADHGPKHDRSDANRRVVRTGPLLFADPHHDDHAGDHSEDHSADQTETPAADEPAAEEQNG